MSHSHLIPMTLQHKPGELQKIIERGEIDMKKILIDFPPGAAKDLEN